MEPVTRTNRGIGIKIISWIALILVIIGALNLGMVGFFNINVLGLIFGYIGSRVVFALIGLAGLWSFSFFKLLHWLCCEKCEIGEKKDINVKKDINNKNKDVK